MTILALLGALALATIPLVLGWRRTADAAEMARVLGLSAPERRFDLQKFARQTGTGLSAHQLLYGFLLWTIGGLLAGLALGPLAAFLFALGGGLLYYAGLATRRQEVRLRQARDILRGLGVVETLLAQGRPLSAALEEAATAVGPDGQAVLRDLIYRLRAAPADRTPEAVRAWTLRWDHPAVDQVGVALLAAFESRIEIAPLVAALRQTLSSIVEVLSRSRAAARGMEWQVRFLALFPPGVLVAIALITPEMGELYAAHPWLVLPVLFGSSLSYLLSMRMIRGGLSIEASMGLRTGGQGEIQLDRLGRVL